MSDVATEDTDMAIGQPHPDRPSHYGQDVNEYAPKNNTVVDFPTVPVEREFGYTAPPPDPIPMYQTEAPPENRYVRKAARANYTLGGLVVDPQPIASADLRRKRILIRNNDADTDCWLMSRRTDNTMAAFRLAFGKEIEEFHNDQVWALAVTGSGDGIVTSLSVLQEIEIDD